MSLKSIPLFQNRLSTCEEELNNLVYEIDHALKKSKQDSKTEITILKTALSDYKNKYDSCRRKLKELVKKHEDLKVQYVSLDNTYQRQLGELQEEMAVLKNSFQNWWIEEQNKKRLVSDYVQTEDDSNGNLYSTVANLKEQVTQWSERAKNLGAEKQEKDRQLDQLEEVVCNLREQLSTCRQEATLREAAMTAMSSNLETLAEKAQRRFLQEEAVHQRAFTANLDAKIKRFQLHIDSSSTSVTTS